jgi:pyruvate/2-oxoglutarate dehydrogenase complex dihydrolipoamide dehydrogenase (E3) component
MRYDLAIIGSGAAGFSAAINAAEGGATVIMIERGETGGTCVNTGCVPSKALLAAAAARHSAATLTFPGVATQADPAEMAALIRGKDDLVAGMRAEKYVDLAAAYDWQIIHGAARFAGTAGAPRLEVSLEDGGSATIEARHYLTATGSAPQVPPIPGLEEAGYLTSTTAMELPESMAVIGGNAVGLELGQLFARLGTRLTIVEALDRLAPFDEPEISAAIGDVLGDEGTGVVAGATVTGVRTDGRGRSVLLKTAAGGERSWRASRSWSRPAAVPSARALTCPASACGPAAAARSSPTRGSGPATRGSGRPGTPRAARRTSTPPPPRVPSPPPTLFFIPNGRWITPPCPVSHSPARRSRRPASPRPAWPGPG